MPHSNGFYSAVYFGTRTTEAYGSIIGYNNTLKDITFITGFASVTGLAFNL
jgi:hypothetical protein